MGYNQPIQPRNKCEGKQKQGQNLMILGTLADKHTVCPGSSDPPEKIFNISTSENEVYTIY